MNRDTNNDVNEGGDDVNNGRDDMNAGRDDTNKGQTHHHHCTLPSPPLSLLPITFITSPCPQSSPIPNPPSLASPPPSFLLIYILVGYIPMQNTTYANQEHLPFGDISDE